MYKYYQTFYASLQEIGYEFTNEKVVVNNDNLIGNKPVGAYLWACTYDEANNSTSWTNYCEQYLPERLENSMLYGFYVSKEANILTLDTEESMKGLDAFIVKGYFDDENLIDWVKLSNVYDGLYIAEEMVKKYSYRGYKKVRFSGWCIETLLVWNTTIVLPSYEKEVIG